MTSESFYGTIPVFRGFASLMDPSLYSPLPEDWTVGVADIVDSTKAIATQRYKAVNMAGAAVIAAITNALEGREFPFVFGGDGASFAVAPDDLAIAREALAATATWVREDLDLTMRVALVPVSAIRAQGLDVRVARSGPNAVITVRDHGVGVLPEHRNKLFDRYYQAHRDRSGMGLGLYIAREIVERHGGTIYAESPEDGGTRFVVSLPTT